MVTSACDNKHFKLFEFLGPLVDVVEMKRRLKM